MLGLGGSSNDVRIETQVDSVFLGHCTSPCEDCFGKRRPWHSQLNELFFQLNHWFLPFLPLDNHSLPLWLAVRVTHCGAQSARELLYYERMVHTGVIS